jgi:hypothetical protein
MEKWRRIESFLTGIECSGAEREASFSLSSRSMISLPSCILPDTLCESGIRFACVVGAHAWLSSADLSCTSIEAAEVKTNAALPPEGLLRWLDNSTQ